MKMKRQPGLLCLALVVSIGQSLAADSGPVNQAAVLYQQGKYQQALPLFKKAVQERPQDANSLYFYGLTLHRLGQVVEARQIYKKLIETFPTSPAAKQAAGILFPTGHVRQSAGRATTGQVTSSIISTAVPSDFSSLPQETRVYFQRDGNSLMVDAQLNNRAIKMVFDTGAEICSFGKNHLRELGLPLPQGNPTGEASGVGDGGAIPTWDMVANLKVGSIDRKNVRISVQENLPGDPLLGQNFFNDFHYTIDNGANSIHFVIKERPRRIVVASKGYSPSASAVDRYTVPFTREGNEMIVVAEVNGKPIRMIFDTGASATVFTLDHIRQLGITIPEDEAEEERHIGIAGETSGVGFPISRIRLGPIEKSNFRISVIQGMSGHPLLGQTFYGDWQYSIDNAAGVIRFVRR